jgi:hypothetical protein
MSAAAALGGFVHPVSPLHHSALLYSVRFQTPDLVKAYPPRGFHKVANKNLVWKMIEQNWLEEEKEQQQHKRPRLLRFARYDSSKIPFAHGALLTATTQFSIVRSVYGYESSSGSSSSSSGGSSESHWYVNFADKHLFGFYNSQLFAQDEWQCLEHPSLCSVREYLVATTKLTNTPATAPLTVAKLPGKNAAVATPCLVMNAPREVEIDAVGAKIYGNEFTRADEKIVQQATRLIRPATLSNILAMEALKHQKGAYTPAHVCDTLHTALASFIAARTETIQEQRDSAGGQKDAKRPAVIIHTGNWGCGAFGGDRQLMCILQVLAARIADVQEVRYHVLTEENAKECEKAMEVVKEILDQLQKEKDEKGSQCVANSWVG